MKNLSFMAAVLFIVAGFNSVAESLVSTGVGNCGDCYWQPVNACHDKSAGDVCKICYGNNVGSAEGVYTGTCKKDDVLKCVGPWTVCEP